MPTTNAATCPPAAEMIPTEPGAAFWAALADDVAPERLSGEALAGLALGGLMATAASLQAAAAQLRTLSAYTAVAHDGPPDGPPPPAACPNGKAVDDAAALVEMALSRLEDAAGAAFPPGTFTRTACVTRSAES